MHEKHVILVVEDDALVRMSAVDMVGQAGHEILQAENADAAIAVLERRPDVTVVFTDIDMPPGMNGVKLAAAVRRGWPQARIIATSGRVRISEDDLPEGSRFLPKPYTSSGFSELLSSMVE